ncbi:MAG: hypothetical protein WB239_19050 [Acidimicrobiia bacterium]
MTTPRDAEGWAPLIERLGEDSGVNMGGRRLNGPQQGFGPLWQKTYRVELPGVEPETVIAEWKANYGEFWPRSARFNAPLAGIKPGEVGSIKSMQMLSTGILVLYADETSFAFMTPEGHPFAGWITFSAYAEPETVAQVQLMLRPNDPLWDAAFMLGVARTEDRMWQHTLRQLARHFGIEAIPQTQRVKLDGHRLWRNAGNVRKNAMFGSLGHMVSAPFRSRRKPPSS